MHRDSSSYRYLLFLNFNSNFLRLENLPGLEQTALRKSLAKSASISVSVSVFEVDTSSADLSFSISYSL